MSQRTEARKSPAQGSKQKFLEPQLVGRVWPNLVFISDLEKDYVEFRAQCEVHLPPSDASEVQELLFGPEATRADFERALEIILRQAAKVDPSPEFKDIVARSFRCQPKYTNAPSSN